jgi:hypothetical protein
MIFLAPALALGTTSPLVASMALARSTRTGMVVGNVYAWGAFGSIVGTFLTGFYLIDVWGSRAIVGMTAGVLALLAVAVAGSRWAFRAAVVFGWLQLLTWCLLAATLTKAAGESVGRVSGEWLVWTKDDVKRSLAEGNWRQFGGNFAHKLHELGLLVKLRDDQPGGYHDESSYSYIHVGDDYTDGAQVRYLRLDKLIHSYYEPDNPTALHYEYEQVYAAVTKVCAPGPSGPVSVRVPEFPGDDDLLARLPAGAHFDAATRTLKVDRLTSALTDALKALSADAAYWTALEQLHKETSLSTWGGFSSVALSKLPEGVELPAELVQTVRHDAALEVLTAYDVISADLRDRLINLSPQAPWLRAVQSLQREAGPLSTLFLGGGGFVFPRWVAAEYPGAARIDVAELDPAVHRVVQLELGLSPIDERRIRTVIGDARNFVQDAVSENRRRAKRGEEPILYDFIYGDAFNDFSVPFHLATAEFNAQVRDLLWPAGVFQQNIIDIYPRTEAPGGQLARATVDYGGQIPPGAIKTLKPGQTPEIRPEFAPLKATGGVSGTVLKLTIDAVMSFDLESALIKLDYDNVAWNEAVRELAETSRQKVLLPVPLPEALVPPNDYERDWTPLREPFAGVETYRIGQNGYALGFRGAASKELEQRLIALDPASAEWTRIIRDTARESRKAQPGRFLARYVQTVATVFPCIYVFSTSQSQPTDDRDTFVVVCSRQPLALDDLSETGLWTGRPFATRELREGGAERLGGQMDSLLELSGRIALTDDFAPVDNLLKSVFALQD